MPEIDLVRAICLHEHKIDHIAHLCPAQAAGIGTLLGLKQEVIYQAVQQAVHVGFTTRQSRKGEISSWKAFAPAHAGKLAVEAVDRAYAIDQGYARVCEIEEKTVTPAMLRIEAEDPDRQLAGLEHRLKGKDRLTEKIEKWLSAQPDLQPVV